MAALDDGVLALQLTQGPLHHFVGHGAGEKDHQVGIAQLVPQAPGRLGEHLGLAPVRLTELLVPALHALVSSQYHNAHSGLLSMVKVL